LIDILRGKKGSASVFLAMAFVTFAICIAAAIGISRKLVVKSECESFGHVWTKAILSEYDRNLLTDYSLLAYSGSGTEVIRKLDSYMHYSVSGKLDVRTGSSGADLTGYELGDPDNFREAMKKGFGSAAAGTILNGSSRRKRADSSSGADEDEEAGGSGFGSRTIGNTVVIDTLPSGGVKSTFSVDRLVETARSIGSSDGIRSSMINAGLDVVFIEKYFGNYVTSATDKECWFRSEWEYIVKGSMSDEENMEACRKRLFLMRNALDLAALYSDETKVEMITTAAELITPGPAGILTQALIAEAWAAMEAEEDMKALYDNERVPIIKKTGEWKIGLDSVLSDDSVRDELDEESLELMNENSEELNNIPGISEGMAVIKEGLNYDDHLMIMILSMNSSTRLLRIMDLVQINMKFRYYRDFNLMEYFTGVRFAISANGRDYVFEDSYK